MMPSAFIVPPMRMLLNLYVHYISLSALSTDTDLSGLSIKNNWAFPEWLMYFISETS